MNHLSARSTLATMPEGHLLRIGADDRLWPSCGKIDLGFAHMLCHVLRLGTVDYGEAYRLQLRLCQHRLSGGIPDTLLLLQHPPTITIGKSGKPANILVGQEELCRNGVSLFFTDRGGDVTYHGPGQLVVYPIVDLRQRDRDVHAYVNDLEEVVIRTLARFGISGNRNSHAGVWVGEEQVAAIGIAIKRWITMHGIALNVKPQQDRFSLINPCGLPGVVVTSIQDLTGTRLSVDDVSTVLVSEFASVFAASTQESVGAFG